MSRDQSPFMFYAVGLSYLDAADHLTLSLEKPSPQLRLAFDVPVRHLYAHAWEMCQKACLFQQGMTPDEIKRRFGHWLLKAWDHIDRSKFAALKLDETSRAYAEWLDQFHPTKEYAYPYTGYQAELSLEQLREGTARFRISRDSQFRLFSHSC